MHPAFALACRRVGEAHFRGSLDPREATPFLERALSICGKLYGPDSPRFAHELWGCSGPISRTDLAEAESMLLRAMSIFEAAGGHKWCSRAVDIQLDTGLFYERHGRLADAEKVNLRALACAVLIEEVRPGYVASVLRNVGAFYGRRARYLEAEALLLKALEILEAAPGSLGVDIANVILVLAEANTKVEDKHLAAELYDWSLGIYLESASPSQLQAAVNACHYERALRHLGFKEKAKEAQRRICARCAREPAWTPAGPMSA